MSDINALESRISAALERVRQGVDRLGGAAAIIPAAAHDTQEMQAQLAEEKTVNSQLEERVKALKDRQDGRLSELEAVAATQKQQLADYDREMQRLQQVNAELRVVAQDMRASLLEEVAEPELVNRAALAELEALQAAQAADRAEVEVVVAQMKSLIGEGQ